jgi:RNA recognition motif-containing protein
MGKKLYVGNLPYSVNDEALQSLFAQAGTVESANVISDFDSGRSKGFGFVEMSSDEEAAGAIEKFNDYEVDGRKLVVNEAKPKAPRENRPRSGGGGYRGGNDRGRSGGFGGGGPRRSY